VTEVDMSRKTMMKRRQLRMPVVCPQANSRYLAAWCSIIRYRYRGLCRVAQEGGSLRITASACPKRHLADWEVIPGGLSGAILQPASKGGGAFG
jgi:hypothetical protein